MHTASPHLFALAVTTCVACSPPNVPPPVADDDIAQDGDRDEGVADEENGDGVAFGDVGGETEPGDADQGDVDEPVLRSACGMPAYSWLPPGSTGAVLEDHAVDAWEDWELTLAQLYAGNESGVRFARQPENDVDVHRIRYQTQDRGELIDATALVMYPDVAGPGSFPVLLFLHGTCGFNDACAPSRGVEDDESDTYANAVLMAIFASWGYILVAPDYIGLKSLGAPSPELHPYLVGEPTAIAAWDAVRAAVSLVAGHTGQAASEQPVVIWGASQGGHAAAFSVRYAPSYAPEYDIAGAVYAIPPTDLLGQTTLALQQIRKASANTVVFLATSEQWYGPLPSGLSPVINAPYDAQLQPDLMAACLPGTLEGVTALEQVFTPALLDAVAAADFASMQPWHCMAADNSLPTTSMPRAHDVPALMILAENDDLVDPVIERASFATLCGQGERLELLQCSGAAHTEAFFWSVDDALDFLDARLAGAPLGAPCVEAVPRRCQNTP